MKEKVNIKLTIYFLKMPPKKKTDIQTTSEENAKAISKHITDLEENVQKLNVKVDELSTNMEVRFTDMDTKINDLRSDMNTKINDLRGDMNTKIDGLRSDMNTKFNKVDTNVQKILSYLQKTANFSLDDVTITHTEQAAKFVSVPGQDAPEIIPREIPKSPAAAPKSPTIDKDTVKTPTVIVDNDNFEDNVVPPDNYDEPSTHNEVMDQATPRIENLIDNDNFNRKFDKRLDETFPSKFDEKMSFWKVKSDFTKK